MPGSVGHGRKKHGKWGQKERPRPAANLQPRQHVAGAGGETGVDTGRASKHEGEEARDQDAEKRGRALHARQREPGVQGLWVQTHHGFGQRAEEVRQVVRQLLRDRDLGQISYLVQLQSPLG